MKLNSLFINPIQAKTPQIIPTMKGADFEPTQKTQNPELVMAYLQYSAVANAPAVNKVDKVLETENQPYKNNLKSMIQNNRSVMLAIVPRSFTAQDLNGDEKISLSQGEKAGTLLSAIERLDIRSGRSARSPSVSSTMCRFPPGGSTRRRLTAGG